MSRKPILPIIVVDKSQSLCIFAQRRIPPARKAAAVGRKVVDFCPKTVQFFAIVVEFSLAGGRLTLVSHRAHAHLRDTPSRTVPPPCRFPARKTAKRTFGGGGTRLIYIATRRSRKASCHSPGAPAPLWTQGNRAPNTIGTLFHAVCCMVSRSRHTASRSQRHRSAQAVRSVGTDRPPPHTARPLAHATCPPATGATGSEARKPRPVSTLTLRFRSMKFLFACLRRYFTRRQNNRRNERAEDFLKALLEAGSDLPRSAWDALFRRLGLDRNAAAQTLGRLVLEGRITVTADAVALTPKGRRDALALMRAHRIYEQYLAEHSGYAPSEWHERAHHMEHRLDARERERMAALLGNPLFDPHGDPIPTAGLALPALPESSDGTPGRCAEAGALLRVVHIEDDDARRFARIAATGLAKDAVVRMVLADDSRFVFDYEGERFTLPAADLAAIDTRALTDAEAAEVPADAFRMSRLAEGQTAVVAGLSPSCRGALRRRLMDLGFVRGSRVSVGMRSPLGNPVAYVVRGTAIALRREQAHQIIVTPL